MQIGRHSFAGGAKTNFVAERVTANAKPRYARQYIVIRGSRIQAGRQHRRQGGKPDSSG